MALQVSSLSGNVQLGRAKNAEGEVFDQVHAANITSLGRTSAGVHSTFFEKDYFCRWV